MSRILITGGNGVLGSALSQLFLGMGNEVTVMDTTRKNECWRLEQLELLDQVDYLWKASQDTSKEDLKNIDFIIDCAIGFPDRPFGTSSPTFTIDANIGPALGLLEAVRGLDEKPTVIYPSSFNALYGNTGIYDELTFANPTTLYGWTKAAVEQLYRTYHHSFGVPVIITRVGSGYGEMMRTDELVAKLIISGLKQEKFSLKSPHSRRLWTYLGDAVNAYRAIAESTDYGHDLTFFKDLNPEILTLNIAGNRGDAIVDNLQLTGIVTELIGSRLRIDPSDEYELGELVNGAPIDFGFDARLTRSLLGWEPEFSLKEGIERTVDWFARNLNVVRSWS